MRKAAKILTIIGMVIGCWMILPIIFGILALKKMNSATEKGELIAMGVLNIIFCSPLGGIFMLCIPEDDFPKAAVEAVQEALNAEAATAEAVAASTEAAPAEENTEA